MTLGPFSNGLYVQTGGWGREVPVFTGSTGGVGGATAGTESLGQGQAPVVYLGYARDRTG